MVALTWGRIIVGGLALAVIWALTLWRAYVEGQRSEDTKWIERLKAAKADAFAAGQRSEAAGRRWIAETAEAARLATIRANRRQGAKSGWARRKGGIQ